MESYGSMNGNDMKRVLFFRCQHFMVTSRCSSGGLKFEKGTGHDRPHITDAWSCMHAVVCSSDGQFCSPFAPTISPPDKMKGMYQRLTQEDSSFRDDHVDPCCKHMQENTNEVYSCLLLYHVNDEIDENAYSDRSSCVDATLGNAKGSRKHEGMRKDVCTEHVVSCPVVIEKRGNSWKFKPWSCSPKYDWQSVTKNMPLDRIYHFYWLHPLNSELPLWLCH